MDDPLNEKSLLIFIISAKWVALVFLSLYFIFMEMVAVVAISAISDGLMGLLVLLFFLALYTEDEADG